MWLKHAHIVFALISISGFCLRGGLKLFLNKPLNHKLWKILPHVNDTLLLASAVGLMISYQWNPIEVPWVMAKLVALVGYVVLGLFALKLGKTLVQQRVFFVGAIVVFGYILMTAVSKQAFWML